LFIGQGNVHILIAILSGSNVILLLRGNPVVYTSFQELWNMYLKALYLYKYVNICIHIPIF